MKKLYVILMLLVTLTTSYADAAGESLSRLNRKKMILATLDAVDNYEYACNIQSQQARSEFVRLFENSQQQIFCDIYTSPYFLDEVSVSDYASFFLTQDKEWNFGSYIVTLKNVRVKNIENRGGKWYCTVSLLKEVELADLNYVHFPVGPQNPDHKAFQLEIVFSFNDQNSSACKIHQIKCLNQYDFQKVEDYYIIRENSDKTDSERDKMIRIGGNSLEFNDVGQAYSEKGRINYDDDDIQVSVVEITKTPSYEYISFKYKATRMRFRLRNEYAPLAYMCDGNTTLDKTSSWAYTIGADLGYVFPITPKFRLGIYTGVAWSISSLKMQMFDLPEYSYILTSSEGRTYTRSYSLDNVTQQSKSCDLMVPIYLGAEIKLDKKVDVLVDLGVKSYFNTTSAMMPLYITGNVSGTYKNGTAVPETMENLGVIDGRYDKFLATSSFYRNPNDWCLMGGVGVSYQLIEKLLYAQFKVAYEYGLTKTYQSENPAFISAEEGLYPLAYSGMLQSEVVLRSLVDCVSIRRSAVSLNLGLMIKF